jgi:DNA polymerase III delta subunit
VQDVRGGIFDLTDAIAAGRTDHAVRLLQALLFRKEPTTLIRFCLRAISESSDSSRNTE